MNKYLRYTFLFLAFIFILTACQGPTQPIVNINSQKTPTNLPSPAAGKAVITGRAVSIKNGTPFVDTPVRLAQIYRQGDQGAFVLDTAHSPSSVTDSNGTFILVDITPAEYLIVIGDPDKNNYIIYQDGNGKPYTYQVKAGQTTDIGVIKTNYTP